MKGGISFSYGLEMGYRIETDHELVKGWETLISNSRFPSDVNPIRGNYLGTGELEGVVVQYELVPTDLSDLSGFCGVGVSLIFGAGCQMSGRVHNYETPRCGSIADRWMPTSRCPPQSRTLLDANRRRV
jgi:hypothetical protein